MTYVYDSSFVVAIIMPDENSHKIDNIHNALNEDDIVYIPQLFWYEVANIFRNLIRRKRFSVEEVSYFFPMFSFVDFTTDYETSINYSKKIWDLGNIYNISAYDAAYLELAERKKAVLCTLDENLKNTAKKHGVEVIC